MFACRVLTFAPPVELNRAAVESSVNLPVSPSRDNEDFKCFESKCFFDVLLNADGCRKVSPREKVPNMSRRF